MLSTINDACSTLKQGGMVILVDDENRENEGDLCILAEMATPENINFMATHGRGLICLTLTQERADSLDIPPMVSHNTSRFRTGFTVSIEAASGVSTGISAKDRAHTIRVAAAPDARAEDLARPGHIFPIIARNGGVLVRVGQTEGSVDLAKLCGAKVHAGVICEIMNDDGTMARMPDLELFAQKHNLPIISIADIIAYRLQQEGLVEEICKKTLPSGIAHGFDAHVLRSLIDNSQILALCIGLDNHNKQVPLVRVHSGSLWQDCFELSPNDTSLRQALETIRQHGCGALLYICEQTLDLCEALCPAQLQITTRDDDAINRPAPDTRLYGVGAQCLRALGISNMILLTDSPRKLGGLEGFGLHIVSHLAIATH